MSEGINDKAVRELREQQAERHVSPDPQEMIRRQAFPSSGRCGKCNNPPYGYACVCTKPASQPAETCGEWRAPTEYVLQTPRGLLAYLDDCAGTTAKELIVEITAALRAERERAASIVDGETCAGLCECFSCEMRNKIAAKIRGEDAALRGEDTP